MTQEGDIAPALHQDDSLRPLHTRFGEHTQALGGLLEHIVIGHFDDRNAVIILGDIADAINGHQAGQGGDVGGDDDLSVGLVGKLQQRLHQHHLVVGVLRSFWLFDSINYIA
ncbi:hypothetical protein D3C80_1191390 [compost metagenome]